MAVIFPRWTNKLPQALGIGVPIAAVGIIFGIWYWFSPSYTDVGYRPQQPVAYSHLTHVWRVGIDCRFCHNTVERSSFAALPPTETCMTCHTHVMKDSPRLSLVRHSYKTGTPLVWVRVHMLPDYTYFDHSAHLAAGVGCVSCHGRVDKMTIVQQDQPLSMGWCLDCHRSYEENLRPHDKLTDLAWDPKKAGYNPHNDASRKRKANALVPPLHCSGCHR